MMIQICYFVIYIIEGIIFSQYCSAIFDSSHSKLLKNTAMILLYGILFFISLLGNPLINVFAFFVINSLFIICIYQAKWHMVIFHSAISTAVMSLSELIVISLAPYQISYSFDSWAAFRVWVIPMVFGKIVYFLIMYLLGHFSNKSNISIALFNKSSLFLTVIPISSICVMFTFVVLCNNSVFSSVLDWMISISAVLLLALNVIIWEIYNYNLEKNVELMDLQLSLQRESDAIKYYKMLIQQSENQSQLIHDIKKHLNSIALLNKQGKKNKIDSYIKNLICSSELQASVRICNNEFLNAILCRYLIQCRKSNISFRADIRNGVCDFLKDNEMTSLFCNLLDNAVEASVQMPDAFIELSAYKCPNTAFTVISMANSCSKSPFFSPNGSLITNKTDKLHHGHGIRIVKRIVRNYYGEMQNYYSEENHVFHTIITLKNSSSIF